MKLGGTGALKLPVHVEDDGCYIRIVAADDEWVVATTGRPKQRERQRAWADLIVEAVNKTMPRKGRRR